MPLVIVSPELRRAETGDVCLALGFVMNARAAIVWFLVGLLGYSLISQISTGAIEVYLKSALLDYEGMAPGQILSSEEGLGQTYRGGEARTYEISYSYQISGQTLIGSKVGHLLRTERVDEVLEMFPEGKEISVYYAKEYPQESVLLKGHVSGRVLLHVVVVLGLAVLTGVLCGFRGRAEK